jgi:hypothetical protein
MTDGCGYLPNPPPMTPIPGPPSNKWQREQPRLSPVQSTMAIAEVAEYAHLSDVDIEALAAELEAIRVDIEDSRGAMTSTQVARDQRITKPQVTRIGPRRAPGLLQSIF